MAAANKFTTCQFILQSCPFASSALATTCVENWCQGGPYVSVLAPLTSPALPQTAAPKTMSHYVWPLSRRRKASPTPTTHVSKSSDTSSRAPKQTPISANSHINNGQSLFTMTTLEIIPQMIAASSRVATGATAHPTVYSVLEADNVAAVGLCTKYAGAAVSSAAAASSTLAAVVSLTNSKAGSTAPVASTSTKPASTGSVASTSSKSGSSASVASTTASSGSAALANTISSAPTSSSTAKSGAASGGMSYPEMKWAVASLGLLLPGFIIGAL